jgi:hypothetical protein
MIMKYTLRLLAFFAVNDGAWWFLLLVVNLQPFSVLVFAIGMMICLSSLVLSHVLRVIKEEPPTIQMTRLRKKITGYSDD